MAPLTHSLVSTSGDFITNSSSFVEVPDTSLVFESGSDGIISLAGYVWISGLEAEVGLMVDGSMIQAMKVSSCLGMPAQVAFTVVTVLHPGPHRISFFLRTNLGEDIPEGPREWSPRKRKKPKGWAKIERAPNRPAAITAIVT